MMNLLGRSARLSPTAPRYPRPGRLQKAGVLTLGVLGAAGVACGGNATPSAELGRPAPDAATWVSTDGAAGRINLDDVRQAYRDAYTKDGFQYEKFEKRVNEIYEGDNVVLIKVDQQGDQAVVSGWEDLNGDKKLEESVDDQLFSITQKLQQNGSYETRGYGANGYYRQTSFFDGFLPGLLLGSMFSGGRTTYVTPPTVYDSISSSRATYRQGPEYERQRERNLTYGGSVGGRFGESATAAPVSPARTSYQQRQVSSGGFRNSSSSTRSIGSGGKTGSVSSGGGLTGGGGLLALRSR